MNLDEARKLLGKDNEKYTDEELQEVITSLSILADIAIDQALTMTPEERKKFLKSK